MTTSHPALEKTCLSEEHRALGATLVDFNGWEMPVRYGSIPEEHQKVRLSAGLFDLCHMGRLEILGPDASKWVQRTITNDFDAMQPGDARYTLICNDDGGVIDDAIVYRLPDSIFLVVNASNRSAVMAWMEEHKEARDASLIDRSREMAMLAIQGPQSSRILPGVVDDLERPLDAMKYYSIQTAKALGQPARIARTGYTGEDGYEIYVASELAPELWRRLLEVGGNRIAAIGLGARDTLRLEAGMPLYGHELDLATNPYEAGLGFAVKLDKAAPGFIGQEKLRGLKEAPRRRLTGFRVDGKRVARQGMKILHASNEVGVITSGAPSPTLGCPIAMGYVATSVDPALAADLCVDVRGNRERLEEVPLPFYSRTRKKK